MGSGLAFLGGVVAVGFVLVRLVDRRTALYGASVLATTPLWLAQPKPVFAIAVAALAIALFDRALPTWARAAAMAIGLVACTAVLRGLDRAAGHPTFDAPLAVLASKACLPWTPLVPIALVRREGRFAGAVSIVLVTTLVAQVFFGAFLGAAPLACAIAIAARSLDDVDRTAPAVVVTIIAIGVLAARDLDRSTQSATWISVSLSSVALAVPRSWLPTGRGLVVIGAGTMAGLSLLLRHLR